MNLNGVSFIDTVVSTLNRLSGILHEIEGSKGEDGSGATADATYRPNTEALEKNDIYYAIGQQSGAIKRKHRPNLVRTIDDLAKSPRVSLGDRCYLGCQVIPNRRRRENTIKYRDKAFCGTFEKNGNLFITTAQDCVVRIYDTTGDRPIGRKSIHATDVGWSILDTSVSPDGCFFVYSSWCANLYLCRVEGQSEDSTSLKLIPLDNRFCVFSLKFSANGEEILCGASDTSLYVYSLTAQKRTLRIPAHDDEVNAVCFADRSSHILFTGGDDGLVKVWDRRVLNEADARPVGVFAGHRNGVTFVDSKGDGRYLVSNSKDQSIKLWDVRHFARSEGIEATQRAVAGQRWDYRWQPVPISQRVAHIAPLPGDVSIMTYRGHTVLQTLIRCRFSPTFTTGQRYIYTGCASGRVHIYDVLTGEAKQILVGHRGCVRDVSWHPYAPIIMSTSFDGTVKEWVYRSEMDEEYDSFDPYGEVCLGTRRRRPLAVRRVQLGSN
ncbi:DDB1- and CUL4-associated factor 11-like [Tropilaelaps mercedesae]|uniref:DDB1-and CUL4-associated factor 11-like n=1 Tax=Tropilaelaps mercedesae TaxID=418985 RepID=A0A1V9XHM0_9ACAR|nr:DDB1- and CUL4-associated factor 11-like [Tropilaelaps mercedesae]